jgi:hypothetical protein
MPFIAVWNSKAGNLSPALRIFLCLEHVDLRKTFDGLAALFDCERARWLR